MHIEAVLLIGGAGSRRTAGSDWALRRCSSRLACGSAGAPLCHAHQVRLRKVSQHSCESEYVECRSIGSLASEQEAKGKASTKEGALPEIRARRLSERLSNYRIGLEHPSSAGILRAHRPLIIIVEAVR